jgi:hypothetical protein
MRWIHYYLTNPLGETCISTFSFLCETLSWFATLWWVDNYKIFQSDMGLSSHLPPHSKFHEGYDSTHVNHMSWRFRVHTFCRVPSSSHPSCSNQFLIMFLEAGSFCVKNMVYDVTYLFYGCYVCLWHFWYFNKISVKLGLQVKCQA